MGGGGVTHSLLTGPFEGEFLPRRTASALGGPSCVSPMGPGLLAAETTPYSPSIPHGSWKKPRLLRTRKPWRTSLSQSAPVVQGRKVQLTAVFCCIFVISVFNPCLLDSLAMGSVVLKVLGTKSSVLWRWQH